jgi:hypothetical protein
MKRCLLARIAATAAAVLFGLVAAPALASAGQISSLGISYACYDPLTLF